MGADLYELTASHRPFASLRPLRQPKLEEYARRARDSMAGGGGVRDDLPMTEAMDSRLLALSVGEADGVVADVGSEEEEPDHELPVEVEVEVEGEGRMERPFDPRRSSLLNEFVLL